MQVCYVLRLVAHERAGTRKEHIKYDPNSRHALFKQAKLVSFWSHSPGTGETQGFIGQASMCATASALDFTIDLAKSIPKDLVRLGKCTQHELEKSGKRCNNKHCDLHFGEASELAKSAKRNHFDFADSLAFASSTSGDFDVESLESCAAVGVALTAVEDGPLSSEKATITKTTTIALTISTATIALYVVFPVPGWMRRKGASWDIRNGISWCTASYQQAPVPRPTRP